MAAVSPFRVRVSGFVLALCAAGLGAFGYYLTCLALHWAMPAWIPAEFRLTPQDPVLGFAALPGSPVGMAAAFLLLFAAVAGLNALWMLVFGRRNWLLVAPLLMMFLIFLGTGLWIALGGVPTGS
jgi:hypothetical protein